jgi:hypothetical protein
MDDTQMWHQQQLEHQEYLEDMLSMLLSDIEPHKHPDYMERLQEAKDFERKAKRENCL